MTLEDQVPAILNTLPNRISRAVEAWAERSPDRPALVEASGAWTYGQLQSAVVETRDWLLESGVRPGDRVMIVCENCRAFVAILLALAGMDAWPALVNARLSAREIDQIREHCGARRVIYTVGVSTHAEDHAKRHGAIAQNIADMGPIALGPLNPKPEAEPLDPCVGNRVAALIYTSGTTGQPKGVMLTHSNVLFIAAISARIRSLSPEDRFLGVLPMTHAVGLSVVLLGTLLSGACLQLVPRFDPMTARKALEQVTVALGTPAMFSMLLEYAKMKGLKTLRFPQLRIIATAGAPLHLSVKLQTESLLGLPLHNGYGVTECSPTIAQTRVESTRNDISVGPVFPGVEIKLAGPDRKPVAEGEIGELCVRGPSIMKGYYRAPEETAAAIDAEGWFNTRDLARLEDGNLFIVGRTKELIVRFGFNVYPVEVEGILNAYPGVIRSAVIGRPSQRNDNEEIVAFVQLPPQSQITVTELAEYAAAHLAPYKRPSEIILVTEMPVTPTGKVVKGELAKLNAYTVDRR